MEVFVFHLNTLVPLKLRSFLVNLIIIIIIIITIIIIIIVFIVETM